jgi:hypothetical protein
LLFISFKWWPSKADAPSLSLFFPPFHICSPTPNSERTSSPHVPTSRVSSQSPPLSPTPTFNWLLCVIY